VGYSINWRELTLSTTADVIVDNPILVKHLRSRLRMGQVMPWAAIILVLSACISWAGVNLRWFDNASAVMSLVGLQIFVVVFGGSSQMTTSLGGARESGLLDFHRVSPVPPSVLALGFFLGAPIREYALAAITVPFALFSAAVVDSVNAWRGLRWFLQLEAALLLTTWIVHVIAMLGCLTRKKPRGSVQGTIVTVVVMLVVMYLGSVGFYFGSRWLLDEEPTLNFFGVLIPWLPWLALYELPILGFLGLAVVRKIRAERMHAYSKPQVLACMATLSALALGGLWNVARLVPEQPPVEPTGGDIITLAAVYVVSLGAMVLTLTVTPDSGEYIKGVRRAGREGRRRPSPWSDAGSNRVVLFILCGMILVVSTAVVNVVGRQPLADAAQFGNWPSNHPAFIDPQISDQQWLASRHAMVSRPIAVGVLTAAYVGLAFQYFSLRTRRSGLVLLTLLVFVTWLVPLLAGAILGMSGPPSEQRAFTLLALSPIPGIALSSGLGKPPGADAIQLAAIAPPITLAFLFNYLLVIAQRKLDRQLHASEKPVVHADPSKVALGEPE
jgi:hypothetical protein